ncbi:hypothetical protein KO361_04680 [Candidatus Woesearchaeota archaeon]|nr:hypothetical protein [Candidatus Woesearchaeota archaeon]
MNIKINKKGAALAWFVMAIVFLLIVVAFIPEVKETLFEALTIVSAK